MGNDKVRSHFERLAEQGVWASLYNAPEERITSENWSFLIRVRRVMELLGEHCGTGDVLDIGCGTAPIARGVVAMGRKYLGMDFSPEMVKSAQEQNREIVESGRARIQVGGATGIAFPNQRAGAVIAMGVLEYLTVEQIQKTLREIQRVLQPSGVALLTIPKRRHWSKLVLSALYPVRWAIRWRPSRENLLLERAEEFRRIYLMPAELDALCREASLAKIDQRSYNFELFGRPLTLVAPRLSYLMNRPFEGLGSRGGSFFCTGYIGAYRPGRSTQSVGDRSS